MVGNVMICEKECPLYLFRLNSDMCDAIPSIDVRVSEYNQSCPGKLCVRGFSKSDIRDSSLEKKVFGVFRS